MTDSYIQLPNDGPGKKMRTTTNTVNSTQVHEQMIHNIIDMLTKKIEYDSDGNAIYIGETLPGNASSVAKWRIRKVTYDANGNPTDVQWADGNTDMDKIWDSRSDGTYTYS